MIWVLIFFMSLVVHEVCHGLVAFSLGDPTAKQAGRLTLNPFKHIDLFWTILMPLLMFSSTQGRFAIGMAKPVPVNFNRLEHPKVDMIWVALAGPFANLFLAGILRLFLEQTAQPLLLYAIYFNLGLAVFNLIPIPPLDGSRVLAGLLPTPLSRAYLQVDRFGFIIILILYFTRVLFYLMTPGIDLLCNFLKVPSPFS